MSFKFFQLSSKEFSDILKSGEFHDIEISVGTKPDTKVFKAHSLILKIRSSYFRKELSKNDITIKNNIIKYNKPNISVKIFDILLKYIYSSNIDITKNDFKTNIALLIAADELCLSIICSNIIKHLFKDTNLLIRNFVLTQHVATHFKQFPRFSQFYTTTFRQDPSLIFKANDFTTIEKNVLLDLVKNNRTLKQIEIWDKLMEWTIAQTNELPSNVTKWTIAQSSELPSDVTKWTPDKVTAFGNIIKTFIPHINFKEITPADFCKKIKPFKKIFDNEFYIQILEYYSSNEEGQLKFGINLMNIDSGIINSDHAFLIGSLIKISTCDNNDCFYDFKLLVRGSRDGFGTRMFHDYCDGKGPTITVASIKDTDEILGGFNPLSWESAPGFCDTGHSFLFSLDKYELTKFIFSKVVDSEHAIYNCDRSGPDFGGSDLSLLLEDEFREGQFGQSCIDSYERLIRDMDHQGIFEIDDYEVFQVSERVNK